MKFQKKPVVIEAIQWTGNNFNEICEFCDNCEQVGAKLTIPTLEGDHTASKGDWIIKGVKGEFYPCKPDIFEQTYDKIN